MKTLLKLEELFMFSITIFLFTKMNFAWWMYPAFILAPDLSMVGYLFNPQIGAWTYNFVHHKTFGISVFALGVVLASQPLQFAGLILFGHSSIDRIFGYGLKYSDSFKHTHLGMIGKT